MRGTFYFRSSTFYHHLKEMRRNGYGRDAQKVEMFERDPPADSDSSANNSLTGDSSCAADPQSPSEDNSHKTAEGKSKRGQDGDESCDDRHRKEKHCHSEFIKEDRSSILLPNLPNEMTIDHILTKLPWTAVVFILPAVSWAWNRAIRNLQVHNARVRTNATQTLVAIIHQTLVRKSIDLCQAYRPHDSDEFEHALAISLYDPSRDEWRLLPPITGVDRGIPYACECVCLDGKVYIFGGYGNFCPTNAVYFLNLAAGVGVWRRCADMKSSRVGFSGGAKDGKLYIFGGTRSGPFEISSECLEAEVFDPEKNTWTSIAPTLHRHTSHCVACVGGDFIVHGGRCWTDMDSDDDSDSRAMQEGGWLAGRVAEVYDPSSDEWQTVKDFAVGIAGAPVVVDGKLHIISERDSCVYAYDKAANSWAASQKISWQGLGFERNPASNVVIEATAWEGEILAAMCSWNVSRFRSGLENWEDQIVLLKSRGLGCPDDLEWDRVASADDFHKQILCMRSIQL